MVWSRRGSQKGFTIRPSIGRRARFVANDVAAVERHFETLVSEGELPVFFYYFREVAGLALASRAPFGGPGGRPRASHGLIKEALRLCGHPIENTVKRPTDEVTRAENALVEKTLRSLGWI